MYCIFCGQQNPDHAQFCQRCGHAVEGVGGPSAHGGSTPSATVEVQGGSTAVATSLAFETGAAVSSEVPAATAQHKPGSVTSLTSSIVSAEPESGCDQIDTQQSATSHVNESAATTLIRYGTLSERFVAYIADLVVIYLIVIVLYFSSGVLGIVGRGFLSGAASESKALVWVALFIYMILSVTLCHSTVGKYIVGLEVASESPQRAYPSFWKVLLRETIGRIVSSFFFGVGYWGVPRHPQGQAWSDQMSGTVVRHRNVNSTLKRALTAFVVIGLVLDVVVIAYGFNVQEREQNHASWQQDVSFVSDEVKAARTKATDIISRQPANLQEWQDNMRQLVTALDTYDQALDKMQQCLHRGDQENLFESDAERRQTRTLEQVLDLRRQQSVKQRQEANWVINYDPRFSNVNDLQSKLRLLDSDVSALDHQASEMLSEAGIR